MLRVSESIKNNNLFAEVHGAEALGQLLEDRDIDACDLERKPVA